MCSVYLWVIIYNDRTPQRGSLVYRLLVSTIFGFFEDYPEAEIVRFKIVASRDDVSSKLSHLYHDISIMNRLLGDKPPSAKEEITCDHGLEASGAAAFRRSVFESAGVFDEGLQRGEDTDFTRRLTALGKRVYYNPHHEVQHQYAIGCLDTARKNFISGRNRYRLYSKYSGDQSKTQTLGKAWRQIYRQRSRSWRHARLIQPGWSLLLYLPGLLVFELLVKAGILWEMSRATVRRQCKRLGLPVRQ